MYVLKKESLRLLKIKILCKKNKAKIKKHWYLKYFGYILAFVNHTVHWKVNGNNEVHKHYFKFSLMGVNDLLLDEIKQYITKEGIRTDIDAYKSCLRLLWKAKSFSQIIRSESLLMF